MCIRDRKKEACDSADQLFLFTVLASVAAVVVMMACRTLIFRGIYGSIEADVEYNANVYMTVVAFSIPFLSLYNAGSAMFRMMEDSATPMKMSLLMNLSLIHIFTAGSPDITVRYRTGTMEKPRNTKTGLYTT